MNTIYIDLMVFPVGGLGIAAAVFMAGPSSNNTTKPVSLGHFLRGSVSSFLGCSLAVQWGRMQRTLKREEKNEPGKHIYIIVSYQ